MSVLFITLSLFSSIKLSISSVSSQYLLNKWTKSILLSDFFPKKNFKHLAKFLEKLIINLGRRNIWMDTISHQINIQIIRWRIICMDYYFVGCCLSSGSTVDKPRISGAETQWGQIVQRSIGWIVWGNMSSKKLLFLSLCVSLFFFLLVNHIFIKI